MGTREKSGLRVAACYSFWPNKLGFCGSQQDSERKLLSKYVRGEKISDERIKAILEKFEAAYAYYQLIAKANHLRDPFNIKVIEAYWVGNELLENVGIDDLRKMIIKSFSKPGLLSRETAFKKASSIPQGSKPHHSFHVLILGPIAGRVVLRGGLLDLCRISWGKVVALEEQKIQVEYSPLKAKDGLYSLAKPIRKEINFDNHFNSSIRIGDWVSFHWDNLVEVLRSGEVDDLKKWTTYHLKLAKFAHQV